MVLNFFVCLDQEENKYKVSACSKKISESWIRLLFRLSFAFIGRFSLANIHSQLSEQFLESQAAFGTNSLKRVTGRIFTSYFIEASRNFIYNFLYTKTTKNYENHQRSCKKYCFDFWDLQKYICLLTLSISLAVNVTDVKQFHIEYWFDILEPLEKIRLLTPSLWNYKLNKLPERNKIF
jgi:hypothetical protein